MEKLKLRVLFIGNSHTYKNDMPAVFRQLAEEEQYDCEVAMLAHGGWYLEQHLEEPETRFNIQHGHYDYVVLQEYAHPFGPEEKLFRAVEELDELILNAKAKTVLYMPWAVKNQPEKQEALTEAHETLARELGLILAPVGKEWWKFRKENPSVELYADDGQHASRYGSWFAAKHIWHAVQQDFEESNNFRNPELEDYLEDLAFAESLYDPE